MIVPVNHRTLVFGFVSGWMALLLGGGCAWSSSQSSSDAEQPQASVLSDAARVDAEAEPIEAAEPATVRSDDIVDPNLLAEQMATGAVGDAEWIAVFAHLRSLSWLASRYPGDYDLLEIYSEEWAAETAQANETDNLDHGLYIDEMLPTIVSVEKTRDLGQLVELDVTLESSEATVRRLADDSTYGRLDGGVSRGLFTIGREDGTDRWRIHSVVELRVVPS